MNEKISVVIPTKNRAQEVIRCIESISIQTMLPDEIVIVDSSDTEGLKSKLNAFNDLNIKYIHSKPGLTLQKNIGIKVSSGDIIIFSDDDMILDKKYINEIMYVFNNNSEKKVGGVTGNMISVGMKNNSIKKFYNFVNQIIRTIFFIYRYGNGKFQPSGIPTMIRSGSIDKITNVEYLSGGSMAFRREVISEFMFDENLPLYFWGEDDDIAYRVSRKYQNIYTPFAKLICDNPPSFEGNAYVEMKNVIESHYYLFKKNLPQDFKHKFAFWWSVIGLFVREGITMVVRGDSSGVRGLASGMKGILKRGQRDKG